MQIGIVGLGLMGGSLAKAIKKYTPHSVCGCDIKEDVLKIAMEKKAIDKINNIENCDMVFVCLYPKEAIEYIKTTKFKNGTVVSDICGVKSYMECLIDVKNIRYVGIHPMAGKETSGFEKSTSELFKNAALIITPQEKTDDEAINMVKQLGESIGFKTITLCSAQKHDKVIAYTSQLAHIVSNAYVKSESAQDFNGFSAGSFQDLTRVAKLNPSMWSQLFMANAENLSEEIDVIIKNITDIKEALDSKDEKTLFELLKQGSEIKESIG